MIDDDDFAGSYSNSQKLVIQLPGLIYFAKVGHLVTSTKQNVFRRKVCVVQEELFVVCL